MFDLRRKECRQQAWPSSEEQITVLSVCCPAKIGKSKNSCGGALVRMQDGAGRLAERTGRMILKCDRCLQSWSVPIPEQEEVRRPERWQA